MDTAWADEMAESKEPNSSNRAHEIKKENPKQRWDEAFKQADAEAAAAPQTIPEALKEPPPERDEVPEKLAALMLKSTVTVPELRKIVASKGYYPEDTLVKNYDPAFIEGVLVGAWDQVLGLIQAARKL